MTEPLFDLPREPRPLTDRQTWIYQYIVDAGGDGLEPAELGALMHARHGKHGVGDRCSFCPSDGLQALKERAIAERVVKRGRSVYVAVGAPRVEEPSSQLTELPGTEFDHIFGLPAPGDQEAA